MDCVILFDAASPPTEPLARAMAEAIPGADVTVLDIDRAASLRCDLLIVGAGVRRRSGRAHRDSGSGRPEAGGDPVAAVIGSVAGLTARGVEGHWYGAFDTRRWSLLPTLWTLSEKVDTALFRQGMRPVLPARSFSLANPSAPSSAELADAAAWAGELSAATRARLRTLARVVRPTA
ncbi:hypothetical protein GCM10010988_03670 [Cnuibacter physcomitrellae]|uniref:Uncharacterized protein n=1 Tax=Cnuibacter physcomitrellae TaxID=1619308 RepID=A0A1X9LLD6_9MICO|nr:hypothetical protein [Cnuibacter physcomitrellae]ARJ05292.1 hypothetical protein B5808_08750 [Cnuibacter physcomitrellae]GGI35387.1 hypothetical protein GCM10010988_03670 [Cnuibacter physcomitrellae]